MRPAGEERHAPCLSFLQELFSSTWGPNLIPARMFPGESVVIVDIACGHYDVLVTDETGLTASAAPGSRRRRSVARGRHRT